MISQLRNNQDVYLSSQFDSIIMLTWSDWETEPRSNRYHYATRFANCLPTFFLQHNYLMRSSINIRSTNIFNLDIIDVSVKITQNEINDIKLLLRSRGFKNPLLWIYDPINYSNFITSFPNSYLVFHATEDYFTRTKVWNSGFSGNIQNLLIKFLEGIDYVVFVSNGLQKVYRELGQYTGFSTVIKNGCDVNFFQNIKNSFKEDAYFQNHHNKRPSAVYQGGINSRIDFKLLYKLISKMDDWDFIFCGKVQICNYWKKIIELPNVKYLGILNVDELGRCLINSTVGIIPFNQDSWVINSLPLKAYEYVACGLPVVTVPIFELENSSEFFAFAKTAEEFEEKIRSVKDTRYDPNLIQLRSQLAYENSYDLKFSQLKKNILYYYCVKKDNNSQKKARVAILYDPDNIAPFIKSIELFSEFSNHNIIYIPASLKFWPLSKYKLHLSNNFDVVIIHFSINLAQKGHLYLNIFSDLKEFSGIKIALIQEEYIYLEAIRNFLDEIYFNVVYSFIPVNEIASIYPAYRYPSTKFNHVNSNISISVDTSLTSVDTNLYIELINKIDTNINSYLFHFVDISKIANKEFYMFIDSKSNLQDPKLILGYSSNIPFNSFRVLRKSNKSNPFSFFSNSLNSLLKFLILSILKRKNSDTFIFKISKYIWNLLPNNVKVLIIHFLAK